MIVFKKYNSIENIFDKEYMDKIRLEGFGDMPFVVQEKIHGANFCFITDGATIRVGKRTGFVEPDENFYRYSELLEQYKEKVINLFTSVKKTDPDTVSVTIFGEMFGGRYPHPDIINDTRFNYIQQGVYYCPYHEFYAFDLYVTDSAESHYLTVDEVNMFFEKEKFFYAKTLFKGTFDECLQ
ncbi:MAG: hypothetical protein LBL13_13785, partial [Bacteroidales bacterium]|nr:hypothetical protein [Bacteroidales bacterium]